MNTASINDDNSDDCWIFVMTVRFTMRLFPDYDHQKKIFTQKSDIWWLVWSPWSIQAVLSASHNSSLKPSIASCVRIHKIKPPHIVVVGGAVILSSYDFLTLVEKDEDQLCSQDCQTGWSLSAVKQSAKTSSWQWTSAKLGQELMTGTMDIQAVDFI